MSTFIKSAHSRTLIGKNYNVCIPHYTHTVHCTLYVFSVSINVQTVCVQCEYKCSDCMCSEHVTVDSTC